jgi:quercetin dioxygenase-like cupin family protein
LLSPDLAGDFEMIRSVFAPGAVSEFIPARAAQDGGYVVSGRFNLWVGDKLFELKAGDSFGFKNQEYRWQNPGDEQAVVIWVISPPIY